jgi:hypothetical protein
MTQGERQSQRPAGMATAHFFLTQSLFRAPAQKTEDSLTGLMPGINSCCFVTLPTCLPR